MSKPKVLISIPNTGLIHKLVMHSVIGLTHDPRYQVTVLTPSYAPAFHNMNQIIGQFLKGPFDWWLTIDYDNPPLRNPLDLISFDLDIVACPTPQWSYSGAPGEKPIYWVVMDRVEGQGHKEHQPQVGLTEVDAVGSGCMLVRRDVVEKVKAEHAEPVFLHTLDSEGFPLESYDWRFCRKAKQSGFKVWAHYDYPCGHVKSLELNEVIRGFKGMGAIK